MIRIPDEGVMTQELAELRAKCQRAASPETCYPADRDQWTPGSLHGHCGAVAYTVRQLLGGEIVSGTVDGERWIFNRLDGQTFCLANPDLPLPARLRPVKKLTHPRFETFYRRVAG